MMFVSANTTEQRRACCDTRVADLCKYCRLPVEDGCTCEYRTCSGCGRRKHSEDWLTWCLSCGVGECCPCGEDCPEAAGEVVP